MTRFVLFLQFFCLIVVSCRAFFLSSPRFRFSVNFQSNQFLPQISHAKSVSYNSIRSTSLSAYPNAQEAAVTDEELAELLEEMIYSGDFTGFMRKKAKEVVNEDFLEYLQERVQEADDEDDRAVYKEIILLISDKIRLSDGIENVESVFEKRLDKILYAAPNKRKTWIEENSIDMTEGFIAHIKKQMTGEKDLDNKVVFASILQLIGQVKGSDFLGEASVLLSRADAYLGEQFAKPASSIFVDGAEVMDIKAAEKAKAASGDRNEQILAGLLFSQNDLLEDVLNNVDYLDDEFVTYLEKKIDGTQDIEERTGMNSLLQTIQYVRDRIKEAQDEGSVEEVSAELTLDQVKQRMREVQAGKGADEVVIDKDGNKKVTFKEFQVKANIKDSFQTIVNRFLSPPAAGMTYEEIAEMNYDLCDMTFLEMLKSEAEECFSQGADIEGEQYKSILQAVNNVMVKRIGTAQDRLQVILSKGRPEAMEAEIVRMCRTGEMDEALILLIEANAEQAQTAGALKPAELLRRLRLRIKTENERKLPDEQRLLRVLMLEDSSAKRKEFLFEAFKPSKAMNDDSQIISGPPLISPPVFINIVRQLIMGFGNVEGFDIYGKAQVIIDEAQVVATELYGEGMTPRDQQRYMFEKNTISVWDLARVEEENLSQGRENPWANDKYNEMNPEEVLGERVKRVGGAQ